MHEGGKWSRGVEEEKKQGLRRGPKACRLYRPFGLMAIFTLKFRSHCKVLNSSMMSWFERISLAVVLGIDKCSGRGWKNRDPSQRP